jgi:hypothetical protein
MWQGFYGSYQKMRSAAKIAKWPRILPAAMTLSIETGLNNTKILSRIYIGKGYVIMPATLTVNTYLPWPPWAA